ncbi:MAG: ABC transporter substrate-binding protein [Candidatus Thorarchaeota archaeon]|jgi:ABC-type transport system substrate-binding protein
MSSWKGKILIPILLILCSGFILPVQVNAFSQNLQHGIYVDKIVYNIIPNEDQQVLALQDDEIDLIGEILDPVFTGMLEQSENIDVVDRPRNGYQILNFNTAKYPFNITAFRRAIAFALDKERICDEVWNGYAVPQDSPIPLGNPYSAEGEIGYTYYEEDNATGNLLLDRAGFLDIDDDGYREAPNGDDFDVLIEVSQTTNVNIEIGEIIEEAFHALHIDAVSVPTDFYEYLHTIFPSGNYDTVLIPEDFDTWDIDWFAYDYWSEYADEPYWNFPNWRNGTFDYWRDFLLNSTDITGVNLAALEMQKIWVHACPAIVIGQNVQLSAYRTDRFEDFVNSVQDGVPCWWTNYRAHLKDNQGGPYGGTLRWGMSQDIQSFNFMVTSTECSAKVNMMLSDSLMRQDPDGNDIMWLAESFMAEIHEDNPDVPDGHTRFTFDIRENITWSDGMPLSGEDVAFTLNYYRDAPGNPLGFRLSEMTAAYAPTTNVVVIEFNTESYWHLHSASYKPIIPKHFFQEWDLDNWNLWNPDPPNSLMITSGPYNVSDYVEGEFIELEFNPDYFFTSWSPANPRPEQVAATPTGNPAAPGVFSFDAPHLSYLDMMITIPSMIVIAVVLYKWRLSRQEM